MSHSRSGFSLIELIAVIAIISILVAILVPVTTSIRASAQSTLCVSNLRGIGSALQTYTLENGGRFPKMVAGRRDQNNKDPALDTVLSRCVDDPEVFACPSDSEGLHEETGTSYFWNSALNGQRTSQLNFFTITDPSRIPVVSDKEKFHEGLERPVNILYADGSSDRGFRLFTDGDPDEDE